MKKILIAFGIAALIVCTAVLTAVLVSNSYKSNGVVGSDIGATGYVTAATSSKMAVTTSDSLVLATSTERQYVLIANPSSNTLFCTLNGGKPAVTGTGITIFASSSLEIKIDTQPIYRGAIRCLSSGSTVNVTVYSY